MSTPEILSIAEFRARLASYLGLVVNDPRARIYVGARRKATAVVMSPKAEVPPAIRQQLLGSFVARTADHILKDSEGMTGAAIGTEAGEVFAWLWRTDPDQAMLRIADLMASIHARRPEASPRIGFDAVLGAFRAAMPDDVTDREYVSFVDECRAQVPGLYVDVYSAD